MKISSKSKNSSKYFLIVCEALPVCLPFLFHVAEVVPGVATTAVIGGSTYRRIDVSTLEKVCESSHHNNTLKYVIGEVIDHPTLLQPSCATVLIPPTWYTLVDHH
jgi:hypothetical protein